MARAQGARAQMALAFESAYGTAPAGGYTRMPFASATLGAEQPLLTSELLGYGRDPLAPVKDAITADGDVVVPIDAEAFGFWLMAAFGAPVSTGAKASGTITFAANPDPGDTITLGGVVWTFVSGTAQAFETKIGGSTSATVTSLATDLGNLLDPVLAQASYAKGSGDVLEITFDVNGTAGNRFTLAASDATPSGPRLTGGGCSHVFKSGSWSLPSMAIETTMPEVPRYAMYTGCVLDKLAWTMQRSGLITATASLIAQGETVATATGAGTPTPIDLQRFGSFHGAVKRNGTALGNVTSASVEYANNLDRIEVIRADGKIDGADPGLASLTGSLEVRFADSIMVNQAIDGTPCALEFSFAMPSGESLTLTAHAVYLPNPRVEISGPQGIQATFDWQAARDAVLGRMATVTLVNNTASYA